MSAILWDLDGTIQDSEPLFRESIRHGFIEVLGREPSGDEVGQLIGRPVAVLLTGWFGPSGAAIDAAGAAHYEKHCSRVRCYPDVAEVLSLLSRLGFRLGVVSSKPRQQIVPELALHGIGDLFEVVVGLDDTARHKPDPAPLLEAARRLSLAPSTCVYIGDQPTDMRAANAAGMPCIGAAWGKGDADRLIREAPTHIARHPREIVSLLGLDSDLGIGQRLP